MVKLSDLLVDKSLHGRGTDLREVIQSQVYLFIYHIRHCNVDNGRRYAVYTTLGRSKRT